MYTLVANPNNDRQRIGTAFSWRRRKTESGKVIWFQKYFYIESLGKSHFNDFTTFSSKFVIGGRPAPYQYIFGDAVDNYHDHWIKHHAFESIEELKKFLTKQELDYGKNKDNWMKLINHLDKNSPTYKKFVRWIDGTDDLRNNEIEARKIELEKFLIIHSEN